MRKKKFKDNSMIFPKLDQLDFFLKISGLEINKYEYFCILELEGF